VIVKDDRFIISTGYNGPPMGCTHCEGVCPRKKRGFKSGEGLEYCPAAHAERNAISVAARLGHATEGYTMYMNCNIPCFECAKSIINAGITEIVVTDFIDYEHHGILGRDLFAQAGVKIRKFEV
jgi:dCMP deaminase